MSLAPRPASAGPVQRIAAPPPIADGAAGDAQRASLARLLDDALRPDLADPVQRSASDADGRRGEAGVHEAAAHGTSGAGGSLPYLDVLQPLFGEHDLSAVVAHQDAAAHAGSMAMGADAFATGNHVAFAKAPDLHTVAHEAAHVVQQRSGVSLSGGVGAIGDPYERNADAVADRVVAGQPAGDLLPATSGNAVTAVQGRFHDQLGELSPHKAKQVTSRFRECSHYLRIQRVYGFAQDEVDAKLDHLANMPGPFMLDAGDGITSDDNMKRIADHIYDMMTASNLLIGEKHNQASARDYLTNDLPRLAGLGYTIFGIEVFGGNPEGCDIGLILIEDLRCTSQRIGKETSLQQALDIASAYPDDKDLRRAVGAYLDSGNFHGKISAQVFQAMDLGMRVLCLDYDVQGKYRKEKISARVDHFDQHAAEILNPIVGEKWVALVGADHLAGMAQLTKAQPVDKREK